MKVLQLGKFYPIRGGVEKVMLDLVRGLSGRGVQCDMLCAWISSTELFDGEKAPVDGVITIETGARIFCVPALCKLAATMISPAMIVKLRRIAGQYDIIHVHHPDPMAALALFFSGYKGRVVLHWHSDILKQKFFLKFYRPLQSWLIRRADVVVCTSPVYMRCSEALKVCQDKATYLPIGIVPTSPDPQGVAMIRSEFCGKHLVFSLGRLIGYKGFEYLVKAASYLPDDFAVVIGGAGPLRDELETLAHECSVTDKVRFIGRVPDDQLADWFGACDVFALSSVMKTEAFAVVQIEAMSCGKPVVSTDIPGSGVPWVNADGISGLVVPVRAAQALAAAIVSMTSDGEVYEGYCRRARKRFDELFCLEAMIDGCQAIYDGLLLG